MKLQEAQQLRMIAERNLEDLQRELQDSKERVCFTLNFITKKSSCTILSLALLLTECKTDARGDRFKIEH